MGNMAHEDLGYAEQHVVHFKEYANKTAREAASGLVIGDDHKVALQTDDHSLWILTAYDGPTWVAVSGLPSGTKMWFYQNTAPAGWTLDATPSDDLLAVKGGAQTFNANGGTGAGTWTVAGLTKDAHTHTGPSHNHQWYKVEVASDDTYNAAGDETVIATDTNIYAGILAQAASAEKLYNQAYTNKAGTGATGAQSDAAITSDATWRPKARLGIICTKD